MKNVTRLLIGPVAVLVLLALAVLLAAHRIGGRGAEEPVGAVVKLGDRVVQDSHATIAFVGLMALFAFVMWIILRANAGEDKAMPPAKESSASDAASSSKARAAMRKLTRLKIGPVAVLVLLALLALVTVYRARHADEEPVGAVVKLGDRVVHDSHATVAVVVLVALFAFVMWTALRAHEGEDKAMPPARESSASDSTAPR